MPSDRNLPDSLGPTSRVIAAGALAGLSVGLLVFRYQVGHLEADAAAHVYALATPTAAAPRAPIIWFGFKSPRSTTRSASSSSARNLAERRQS